MESREILLKIFESQVEMQRIVTLHQAGQPAARDLMKNGQEMLREIRLELQGSTGPGPSSAPSSSSAPNRQVAAQQCREMQRGLAMLHRMTAIPPSNKILDGEVRKTDNLAIAGGSSSDIWRGLWLDEMKVALKGMRSIRIDDKSAQKRFVREIEVWSRLDNEHILQFYGIATDLGPHIHIVCSWLENGGVLEYTKKHPDTDRMHLIRGAAEGLKYLHSENVIHGNSKSIYSQVNGEACIIDFGMAKVLEDVTKTPASTTLARSGSARWLAPEVVEGDPPSQKSDTYSFGMTVLELITGKNPFPQYKTDAAVIRALMSGVRPKRPTEPADQRWLTDDLWDLIEHCLAAADARPTMQDFLSRLGDLGTNYESPVKRPTLDTKLTIEGTITALPEPPPPTSGPTGFLHTLALILGDKETRGTLQKLEGERAQLMIDYLDSVIIETQLS
ncbi:kinase-like protein [Macrolepiota fuliginosa MF-IS2]|uniref:Kinase-like protein n=1 Tax=Macrolepiota fuliginosa MF-IS2 TaxID=1400762 RepID=A0A9P5X4Z9_9AGAR|nr:kinase-like protein [Macrolepiota fuliginosa MF-IS2]